MFSIDTIGSYLLECQITGTVSCVVLAHSQTLICCSKRSHACVCVYDLSERSLQLAARLPMGTNTKMQINPLTLKKIGSAA